MNHEAELQAQGERLEKDRAAAYRREKTKSVAREMNASINLANTILSKLPDGDRPSITSARRKQLRKLNDVIDQGLRHAEAFHAEMVSWQDGQRVPDDRRTGGIQPADFPDDVRIAYGELTTLREMAEFESSLDAATPTAATPPLGGEPDTTTPSGDPPPEGPPPVVWQWMLTAAACVATADGKLGQAELNDIMQTLNANECPLDGDALRTEVIDSCKRIHAEGVQKVATALCDALSEANDWAANRLILQCVQSVSMSDKSVAEREERLVRYFTDRLT